MGGATVQLIQPRTWSRPYGLEAVSVLNSVSPQDYTQRFSYPGSYEFKIPDWCERLDLVVVGGGGGGEGGGALITGSGGSASTFHYKTVIRGVDIPWSTSYIKGVVGAGGRGGIGYEAPTKGDGFGGINGVAGGTSSVTASGMTTMTSAGGAGGIDAAHVYGEELGDLSFNGKNYPGAQRENKPGNRGNHPGGGGAGGWPLIGEGGQGGDGQVWIRAYGWSGS